MEAALNTLRLLHVDKGIEHGCIQREFSNLVTLDVGAVLQDEIFKEAACLSVHAQRHFLIVFHVGVSVNGNKTLFETRRQAIIVHKGAVIQALSRAKHRDGLALRQFLVACVCHHSLAGAGIRQLLHCYRCIMFVDVH